VAQLTVRVVPHDGVVRQLQVVLQHRRLREWARRVLDDVLEVVSATGVSRLTCCRLRTLPKHTSTQTRTASLLDPADITHILRDTC
jgi:predicted GNAT superfamily acetyltransferase